MIGAHPCRLLFLLGAALIFVSSCSNPALVVMDPASDAYFGWQGYDQARFEAAAARAGYRMIPLSLKLSEPFSEQIDAEWAKEGKKDAVLVFPPMLEPEAVSGVSHFGGAPILLLGAPQGNSQDGILRLQINRTEAFTRLGAITAHWSILHPEQHVHILFLLDTAVRKEEFQILQNSFSQEGGKSDRIFMQTWEQPPSSVALSSAAEGVTADSNSLLLLFMGSQNAEFVQSLTNWKNGFYASEQTGAIAENIPNLFASIDVPWDIALENLLRLARSSPDQSKRLAQIDAVLSFYQTKLH